MTDVHTHILPGVDDGAATIEEGIRLLQLEAADGVGTAALTPHFRPGTESLDSFVGRRGEAFARLREAAERERVTVRMVLGAEIAFSAALAEMDLSPLCYEGTRTVLIELPSSHCPQYAQEVLRGIMQNGFTPALAHVERYPYFMRNHDLLRTLTDDGVYAQVTAESLLFGRHMRNGVLSMIGAGLVHAVASDTHGVNRRPPMLSRALRVAEEKTGKDLAVR